MLPNNYYILPIYNREGLLGTIIMYINFKVYEACKRVISFNFHINHIKEL